MRRQVRKRKRKCKNCHDHFLPDYRNRRRQRFCSKPSCRKASKTESQHRWLRKPENRDHFKGVLNVKRVQEWRKKHPGYWRRRTIDKKKTQQEPLPGETIGERGDKTPLTAAGRGDKAPSTDDASPDSLSAESRKGRAVEPSLTESALQDSLSAESREGQASEASLNEDALQDVLSAQGPVLLGLIAHLTGYELQDNIADTVRSLGKLGNDILNPQPLRKGANNDLQTCSLPTANTKTPGGVRLAGSPSGP